MSTVASSGVNIKWKTGAFYKLRSEPGVQEALEELASAIASRANSMAKTKNGFRTSSQQGARRPQGRWRTTVITATAEAMAKNAKHNTLLNAMGVSVSDLHQQSTAVSSPETSAEAPARRGSARRAPSSRRGRWTASEIGQLHSGTAEQVAAATGRSVSAVRAYRQRISRGR